MNPLDRVPAPSDSPDPGKVVRAAVRTIAEELPITPHDVQAARARLARAMVQTDGRPMAGRPAQGRGLSRTEWYGVLGALAGVILLTVALPQLWHRGERGAHVTSYTTYTTANGQRATITLPDGSLAALNVASRLEVPADYTRGNRTLRLVGEALFTVRHHGGAPFTVATRDAHARVLGTAFVVRDYPSDSATIVAVREGKVSVGANATATATRVVTASQEVSVAGRTIQARAADASRFTFASGVLTFKRVPLPDAIVELNRWYDADIRVADPALRHEPITANFAAGSRADLAAILEFIFDARVVQNGRVLTLYPKGTR